MSDNSYIKARNERYEKYVKAVSPSTSPLKSLLNSFWIGGLTCLIGEGLGDLYALIFPELSVDMVGNLTSMTLIALAILFTGLGFYDAIGRRVPFFRLRVLQMRCQVRRWNLKAKE